MAIRCLELGIPACIGVGETLYEKIKSHNQIGIDCANEIIDVYN